MSSQRLHLPIALVLFALAFGTPAEAAKPYRAETFDVKLSVESGGAIVVTEKVRFSFGATDFTFVFRELPSRKLDRLTVLAVEMDGHPMVPGKQAGQYESKRTDNGRRRITWHFAALANTTREFTLVYRVEGIVQQNIDEDLLEWKALPDKHEYPIGCANVMVELPESARLIGPAVFAPAAPVEVMSAASDARRTIGARRCGFDRDNAWGLAIRFEPRTVAAVPPEWQSRDQATLRNAPVFLGVAGLLLAGGLIGFLTFARNHRLPTLSGGEPAQTRRPDDLPVAIAVTLVGSGGGTPWASGVATLFDLARRSVVQFSMPEASHFLKARDCSIRLAERPRGLRQHEQTLLDILFVTTKGPRDRVRFSELTRAFTSGGGWKRFTKAVRAEMRREGLLDVDREHSRRAAMGVGLGLLLLAGMTFFAAVLSVDRAGGFVFAIPAAILISGVTGLIVGSTLSPLSDIGIQRARPWKSYSRHVIAVSKGKAQDSMAGQFADWLPVAAAFGVAVVWAKRLEKQGGLTLPAWFSAATLDDGRDNTAALVAMLSSVNAAGSHIDAGVGGAAAASGAAGGGSSGAG